MGIHGWFTEEYAGGLDILRFVAIQDQYKHDEQRMEEKWNELLKEWKRKVYKKAAEEAFETGVVPDHLDHLDETDVDRRSCYAVQ